MYELSINPTEEAKVRISYTQVVRAHPDEINRLLRRVTQILETEALNGGRIPDWSDFTMSVQSDDLFVNSLTLRCGVVAQ
jgi:hypothetical protein